MYSYDNVIGNENIIEHFKNTKQNKKVAHAYLIVGDEGSGKKLLSYSYAKALQCEISTESACHKCESCIQLESSNNPDIKKLHPEKESSIGVEDIRKQINNDIFIKPYSYEYKIYIIENADRMTPQAQNALLKTLEEPPQYAVILLLVNNIDTLLATIISRCIVLNVRAINKLRVEKYLINNMQLPDYKAHFCATFSKGIIGTAIKLASSDDFLLMKDHCVKLVTKLRNLDIYEILNSIKGLEEYKSRINEYLDLILMWYRDVLFLKASKSKELIIFSDEYDLLLIDADKLTYNSINKNIETIEEAKRQLDSNVNYELTLELMFANIKENA
ncbi:MAG: hypothetical protein K0R15_1027 [Clostridiales bacterium]|jgi:DNA polymerase-3 subunit delta'|nr:hypothetical protein [Clostridiales bacterium]